VNGRRYWTLKTTVPKDAQTSDLPAEATLSLEGQLNGETIKIRIPVKGRAFARGQ